MYLIKRTSDIVTSPAKNFGNKQQGFTLLEVLIALLVLSIGLLGLAALQTTGLRSNEMASMRTTSTMLAYDITDRMRANPQGILDGDYVIDTDPVTGTPTDCTSTDCTTSQLANYDLDQWKNAIATLPGGLGEITQTAGPPLTHTVTVRWDQNRTGATGTTCPPADNDDLRCFRLIFAE
ncbi:MAG: type IV pilus modification protein PilV [Gammaproteobacteria bacterium]|nr:type IV pilus modification protein PilV [Gammaproteobacteria bacterium]